MKVKIAIIGGTGMDDPDLLENRQEKFVDTPFGKPSDALILGTIAGVDCVLLARHDRAHTVMPGNINFRANIWALKQEGCTHLLASTACGSLREHIAPGHLVVLDQAVDRTSKRASTFFDGSAGGPEGICHVSMGHPFHERFRQVVIETAKALELNFHEKGTMVTIEGPRFSTQAESKIFRRDECDVINMTTFPEVALAAEAGLLYVSVGMVTDYDSWREDTEEVSVQMVLKTMKMNAINVKSLLVAVVPKIGALDWSADVETARTSVGFSTLLPRGIEKAILALKD